MSFRKIGIVGYGYVGKAMASFFENHYQVFIYDPRIEAFEKRSNVTLATKNQINKCDVALVCVPTPSDENGNCDTSIVEDTVRWLTTPLILIKSTVSIGTTDRLKEETGKRIVFSPEYCGESSYWSPYEFHTDVKCTPFFTFGGDLADTSKFVDLYMPVTGPTKTYRQTSAQSAEAAKYMENVFYATKILFCYEMNEIFQSMGIDYNEVRELWLLDPRINPMHTSVFSSNHAPFSGKCLPKDTKALTNSAKSSGYEADLIKEVLRSNERIEKLRKDRDNL
jgi:nucleotide sugar dehydrogenase